MPRIRVGDSGALADSFVGNFTDKNLTGEVVAHRVTSQLDVAGKL